MGAPDGVDVFPIKNGGYSIAMLVTPLNEDVFPIKNGGYSSHRYAIVYQRVSPSPIAASSNSSNRLSERRTRLFRVSFLRGGGRMAPDNLKKKSHQKDPCCVVSRWWFQLFFIFIPIWGRFPSGGAYFFRWVETTNQVCFSVGWHFVFLSENHQKGCKKERAAAGFLPSRNSLMGGNRDLKFGRLDDATSCHQACRIRRIYRVYLGLSPSQ